MSRLRSPWRITRFTADARLARKIARLTSGVTHAAGGMHRHICLNSPGQPARISVRSTNSEFTGQKLQKREAGGFVGCGRASGHAELGENGAQVCMHSARADDEALGDLRIAEAKGAHHR
jgi:hypothetical protein